MNRVLPRFKFCLLLPSSVSILGLACLVSIWFGYETILFLVHDHCARLEFDG